MLMVAKKFRGMFFALTLLLPLTLLHAAPAFASLYGSGTYNSCSYQQSCPQPPVPTVTTTPTGLQVAINLENGQKIPLNGYTIVITPINGEGSSFKQADIYIGGTITHTTTPDNTGTARWLWVPITTGSANVKVIITDANGATSSQEFVVTVTPQSQVSTQTQKNVPTTPGNGGLLQHVGHDIQKAVKSLPKPVVHAFPYFLFVFLFVDVLLLLLQSGQELREYRAMQVLLARARAVDDAKKSFIELVSHYLRTPLTIILGSIDLLGRDEYIASSNVVDLKATAGRMKDKIESLIAQILTEQEPVIASTISSTAAWRQPGMFLPIVLSALIWVSFDLLVSRVGNFTLSTVELFTQSAVFTVLAIALYVTFRYRQLKKRDARELQDVIDHEQIIVQSRDKLIADTTIALSGELQHLDELVTPLSGPVSVGLKTIKNGRHSLHELLAKFTIASRLSGTQSSQPYTAMLLRDLLTKAEGNLQDKIDEKGVAIQLVQDSKLSVQEPELLAFVLTTVLDNAIAYGCERSTIEVSAAATAPNSTSVTVSDHGSGIPKDKLSQLFQPFLKAEGAETFNHEGMGFSLYLDKLIMTYLEGTIAIDSRTGHGTTVTIDLPKSSS